jgi:thiamine-phosphate pyrophosphorylase
MRDLPPLQAIVDADVAAQAGWGVVDLAAAFLSGGARLLQLRAKRLESGPFLELCDAVVGLALKADARVIINDRVDLARLSSAAGVHLGQGDLPPSRARVLLGDEAVIGFSTHSIRQIEAALIEPATYTAIGPIFGSRTKDTGYEAVGLTLVSEAASRSGSRPVVAIGGITLETAPVVRAAGATAVAVIGDLLTGGRPEARVREYLRVLA